VGPWGLEKHAWNFFGDPVGFEKLVLEGDEAHGLYPPEVHTHYARA